MSKALEHLQEAYAERGYRLVYVARKRQYWVSNDSTWCNRLVKHCREAVEDVDANIAMYESMYAQHKQAEATHAKMQGKALHEMAFDEWWNWYEVHNDAILLLYDAQKALFPGVPIGVLRRKAAGHPNQVLGYVHEAAVRQAIAEGKPVPPEVMAELNTKETEHAALLSAHLA